MRFLLPSFLLWYFVLVGLALLLSFPFERVFDGFELSGESGEGTNNTRSPVLEFSRDRSLVGFEMILFEW